MRQTINERLNKRISGHAQVGPRILGSESASCGFVVGYFYEIGHLLALQWARQNSCPRIKLACANLSQRHPEMHTWVRAQPEWDECRTSQPAHKVTTRR